MTVELALGVGGIAVTFIGLFGLALFLAIAFGRAAAIGDAMEEDAYRKHAARNGIRDVSHDFDSIDFDWKGRA